MTNAETFNEKKRPMKNSAVLIPEAPTVPTAESQSTRSRSNAMHLINEALSRARTRSPQNHSEARRSALRIAMEARHQQARELGNLSQYGVR